MIPIITRILGIQDYSNYAFVILLSSTISAVAFEWQRIGLIRYLASSPANRDVKQHWKVFGIFCLFIFIISLIIAVFHMPWLQNVPVFLLVMLVLSQAIYDFYLSIRRGNGDSLKYLIATSLRSAFFVIGVILLSGKDIDFTFIVFVLSISFLLSTIVSNFLNSGTKLIIDLNTPPQPRQIILNGAHLAFNSTLSFGVLGSLRYATLFVLGKNDLGHLSISMDIVSQVMLTALMGLNISGFPELVKIISNESHEVAQEKIYRNFRIRLWILAPAMYLLIVAPEVIVRRLIAPDFWSESISMLPILSLTFAFYGLRIYYIDPVLIAMNKTKDMLRLSIASIVLNIFFLFITDLLNFSSTNSFIIASIIANLIVFILGLRIIIIDYYSPAAFWRLFKPIAVCSVLVYFGNSSYLMSIYGPDITAIIGLLILFASFFVLDPQLIFPRKRVS